MDYKYRVWNNTDYNTPFLTNNRRKAEKVWREVKPRSDAGNAYAANFSVRCESCNSWKDATAEFNTCGCG